MSTQVDISVDISVDNGFVFTVFSDKPINYLKMRPDEARNMAQNLIEVADMISPRKKHKLFKTLHNSINDLMSLRNRD